MENKPIHLIDIDRERLIDFDRFDTEDRIFARTVFLPRGSIGVNCCNITAWNCGHYIDDNINFNISKRIETNREESIRGDCRMEGDNLLMKFAIESPMGIPQNTIGDVH